MENSTNSFTKQAHETDDQYSLQESQSGWTDYLDDFGRENSCCTSTFSDLGSSSSSMVSDAASYAAWKLLSKAEVRLEKNLQKFKFQKEKKPGIWMMIPWKILLVPLTVAQRSEI